MGDSGFAVNFPILAIVIASLTASAGSAQEGVAALSGPALTTTAPIGSGLREGTRLIYESGGTTLAPWIYESVRIVPRAEFDRCVVVVRRGQAERESCARADTLFERRPSGEYAAVRPIGPEMELEVRTAAGDVMHYSTGVSASRSVDGQEVLYLPTVIVTRNAAGSTIRQLREQYAPALLTALSGVFEEPESTGGWRTTREFTLAAIRASEPDGH